MIRLTCSMDFTGYGVAAKNTAYSLITAGLDVSITEIINFTNAKDESAEQKIINSYINKKTQKDIKIDILEYIPPGWRHHGLNKRNTYGIQYFFWETDKLCPAWVEQLNDPTIKEIWVPCEYNKKACIDSGVKKTITIMPQSTIIDEFNDDPHFVIGGNPDAFRFYSIFTWNPRKNGTGLVEAYCEEFDEKDNVILVLKSYRASHSKKENDIVKYEIQQVKDNITARTGKKTFPPIYFIGGLLNNNQMMNLHKKSHCYVTANKGEGWNMPIAEAMAMNNPIITTQIGGITEWLDDKSAYIIPNTWESVNGMPYIEWYKSDQNWGKIEVNDTRKQMRNAFNDRADFSAKTKDYKKIISSFDHNSVGKLMRDRLEEIIKENNF